MDYVSMIGFPKLSSMHVYAYTHVVGWGGVGWGDRI